MMAQDPVARYDELLSTSKFAFVVFYRGHWCPFCIAYLKSLQKIAASIKAQNGSLLVVTAEEESQIAATKKASGFDGEILADTQNLLAAELKKRGLLEVAISEKNGYPNGMAQPAVLVVRKVDTLEKNEPQVLYQWAIVPALMNLGGAKDRPDLQQVWDNVQAKLNGKSTIHKHIKTQTFMGTMMGKVFG